MQKIALLFAFIVYSFFSHAQSTLSGTVTDTSNQPLMFATIKISNTQIGTTSNTAGQFSLPLSSFPTSDSIEISFVGYHPLKTAIKDTIGHFQLIPNAVQLGEVIVLPITPLEQLKKSISKFDTNYANNSYNSDCYYKELLKENNNLVAFSEAILHFHNIPEKDSNVLQSQVIHARTLENLAAVQFMEKEQKKEEEKEAKRKLKEEKKAKKKGIELPADTLSDEDASLFSMLGGPENMLLMDFVKNADEFVKEENVKDIEFSYTGNIELKGLDILIIGFQEKRYKPGKTKGQIYIDMHSDAIVAVQMEGSIKIPVIAKPILFVMGISISEPIFNIRSEYTQFEDRFYPKEIHAILSADVTKRRMFSDNEFSSFDFNGLIHFTGTPQIPGESIPKEKQRDRTKGLKATGDPTFWDTFKAPVPYQFD